jgi:hypothetical protein
MKSVSSGSQVERRVNRRSVLSALLGVSLLDGGKALGQSGVAGSAPGTFPWQILLGQLAVTTGPWSGAFRSAPNGPISWYFANLGLAFFCDLIPDAVRNYLNLYISSLNAQNVITDVAADLSTPVAPDSNDAYAGTFLSLAVRYVRATGDSTWWNANLARLKAVAYSNLLTQVKPNGLVRAFQSPDPNGIGYLMDQCEVYAGLRAFGKYLIETNDPDAAYYAGFAMNLGIAIHTQFDANANLWLWCDVPQPPGSAWYPNLTAQIYPHLYDVHSADAPGDYYRLHRGFEVLTLGAPNWSTQPQDLYPWLVVGYYAALRQEQPSEALTMLSMVLQYYLPGLVNTGRLLVSEIGYVRGIMESAAALNSAQPAVRQLKAACGTAPATLC